jgi:hypothetical protein
MSRRPFPTRLLLPVTAIAAGLIGAGFLPMPQPRPQIEPEKPLRLRSTQPTAGGEDEAPADRITGGFALFEPFGGRVAALPPGALRPAIVPSAAPARAEPRTVAMPQPPVAIEAATTTTAGLPPAGVLGYAADSGASAHAALGRFVPEAPAAVAASLPPPVRHEAPPAAVPPLAPAAAVHVAALTPSVPPVLPLPAPGRIAVHVPLPKIRPLPPLAPAEIEESAAEDLPTALPSVLPRPRPSRPPTRLASLGRQPDATLADDAEVEAEIGEATEADGLAPAGPRTLGEPKRIPPQAMPYLPILRREAKANGVPLWLAIGVGWVESRYQPKLKGSHGVLGLMQVMPATARFQGYRGATEGLLDPETNIVWGLRELGWAWKRSGGDVCLTVAKYKGGIMTTTISSSAADYCRTVREVTGMNRLG